MARAQGVKDARGQDGKGSRWLQVKRQGKIKRRKEERRKRQEARRQMGDIKETIYNENITSKIQKQRCKMPTY
jgi:hypothetical protein